VVRGGGGGGMGRGVWDGGGNCWGCVRGRWGASEWLGGDGVAGGEGWVEEEGWWRGRGRGWVWVGRGGGWEVDGVKGGGWGLGG